MATSSQTAVGYGKSYRSQEVSNNFSAQYGTTKYCSAYLRNDTCTNRNCMFLHEPGEDSESFTRQDLSSLNASSSQHMGPSGLVSQSPQPQTVHPPPAAPSQESEQATPSPMESPRDGPALPATASWGDQARRLSRTTNTSSASPLVTNTLPVVEPEQEESVEDSEVSTPPVESSPAPKEAKKTKARYPWFEDLPKKAFDPSIKYCFGFPPHFNEKDRWIVENFPPLFDLRQKPRRGLMERQAELQRELLQRQGINLQALDIKPDIIEDVEEVTDHAPAGSSQLGGEPEERPDRTPFHALGQHAIGSHTAVGPNQGLGEELAGLGARGMTPQQSAQQQLLLQQFKMGNLPAGNHGRQPSRFLLNEAMNAASKNMAKHQANLAQQHFAASGATSFGFSSASGPPPGLKTTGTPPVTGGGMFAQGHGFTQGGFYREGEKSWDGRRGNTAGGPDGAAKRELMFPPSSYQYPSASSAVAGPPAPQGILAGFPYGGQGLGVAAYQENVGNSQKQQKKKGKKHRHANTSSSGGGAGAVDVSDPSILQMRLGGGMVGQSAAFGGQGQVGGFPSALHANAYRGWS
jgi:CCR4-NOT transcription complex subunit 4